MTDIPEPPGATPANPGRAPTVVVSRRARPGAETALHAWLNQIVAAARLAPGFVEAQVQPPDDSHPDEWMVVYRFATFDDLDAWLASEARRDHLLLGQDLTDGPALEQVVALPAPQSEPVTAVSSVRIRQGQEDEFQAHHKRLVRALNRTEGFQRVELLPPVAGHQEETVTVLVFNDRASLQAWLDGEVRRDLLAGIDHLVENDRTVNVVGGWAGWFAPEGTAQGPRRWKQALTVLLALFPVSLIITVIRIAIAPDLGLVPSVLLGNIIGVALLSWVLMPPLTRLLDTWLSR